jgi:hypothetical protein
MPSTQLNPLRSRAEIGILACSRCGNPMRLSHIEPAAPATMSALSSARSAMLANAFQLSSKRNCGAGLDEPAP